MVCSLGALCQLPLWWSDGAGYGKFDACTLTAGVCRAVCTSLPLCALLFWVLVLRAIHLVLCCQGKLDWWGVSTSPLSCLDLRTGLITHCSRLDIHRRQTWPYIQLHKTFLLQLVKSGTVPARCDTLSFRRAARVCLNFLCVWSILCYRLVVYLLLGFSDLFVHYGRTFDHEVAGRPGIGDCKFDLSNNLSCVKDSFCVR